MTDQQITIEAAAGAPEQINLAGTLDFASVPRALDTLAGFIDSGYLEKAKKSGAVLKLDLGGVERCNSAALALLVECKSLARRRSVQVEFTRVPSGLLQLAEVCEAGPLLA